MAQEAYATGFHILLDFCKNTAPILGDEASADIFPSACGLYKANTVASLYHCHVLQIYHVDWPTASFSRASCSITGNHTDL